MTLRTRFAGTLALVALVVAAAVGVLSYDAASDRIFAEVDQSLRTATAAVAAGQTQVLAPVPGRTDNSVPDTTVFGHSRPPGPTQLVAQSVAADGTVTRIGGEDVTLPVNTTDRTLAASGATGDSAVVQTDVGPGTYRVLTTVVSGGRVLQVGTNVDDTLRVLGGMAQQVAGAGLVVVLLAAVVGWLLAQRITRRLVRLTGIAEEVSAGGSVEQEVTVAGRDEVGRLAAAFTTMLDRLAGAREAQNRLVQDAAHELRTPLTSLRTNAAVLRRIAELPEGAREKLIADVQSETRELSHLVDELVDLALAQRPDEPDDAVDLRAVALTVAERARRRTGAEVRVVGEPALVQGRRSALERAVGNLVENAAKFAAASPHAIEVRVDPDGVAVADHGPGFDDTDLDRVFDRFYRADAARALPGSGLGLSIVRDVAQTHGGTAFARARDGGGAVVGFTVGADRVR